MKLNEKIINCRRRAGLSQEALAEVVGVSRQAVSKWECGDAVPEPAKLLQLARTFGVTTDWLLDDTLGEPEPQPTAQTLEGDAEPSTHAQTLDSTPPPTAYPHWVDNAPNVIGRFLRKWGWLAGIYIMIVGLIFVGFGAAGRAIFGLATKTFEQTTNQLVTAFPFGDGWSDPVFFDQDGQVWENPPQEVVDAIGDLAGPTVSFTPNSPDIATRVEPASFVYLVPNLIITIGVIIMLVGLIVTIALRRVGRGERT